MKEKTSQGPIWGWKMTLQLSAEVLGVWNDTPSPDGSELFLSW